MYNFLFPTVYTCIIEYISCLLADFRLSQLLTVDVNSVLRWLHPVYVGDVASVLEVHGSSIFSCKAEGYMVWLLNKKTDLIKIFN